MGNLIETATWSAGVPYFEADAILTGGPDCPDNIPIQALANRTAFLKKQIDDAVSGALTMMYASKLKTTRTITMTGDGSWVVSFDGSGNVSAAMALAPTGVAAGTYPKVTVDAKGRVTGGAGLAAADIPALDWSKITSGKPTTLAGYGITDLVAVRDSVQSWTRAQRGAVQALTDAATIAVDLSLANNFSVTLAGNRTLGTPTNAAAGQSGIIAVTQDASGSRTLAFGSGWKFAGGTAPALSTTAGAVDYLAYYVESSTRVYVSAVKDVR
ncbi:hypothetical protein Ga0061063_0939 [Gulbenkiania indica]|uniref:Uncharacterized protein n=1 Tax=Gulbenkiania indica TaxID=375574 RepID=A0A0K6GU88_9NEIS|nr:hypothetical protein [Gulbenkiania indica]CUA82084.1 hypothetical protein Ga0061063_0939 [Gulbenkiania indica]